MTNTIKLLGIFACAPLLVACSGATTRDEHASNVPESGQAVHQAPAPDATAALGSSQLEEPDPQANVVQGEPPPYNQVMASWADPVGEPRGLEDSAIGLHDDIMDACGIDDKYAFFAFDSSGLSELAKKTIGELATCFTSGPLKGQTILLAGHADPRGTDQYNTKLGKSRAQAVGDYLVKRGMPKKQIVVESHGEQEASANPISWPHDRRVDISIAEN